MNNKTRKLINKVYDYNPETQAYIIKVSIKQYTHIFNDLDPAPLKRRDLNQDLLNYLDDCSFDIPLGYKVNIQFVADMAIKDEVKEKRVVAGLKTYFGFLLLTLKRDINLAYKKCLLYIVNSFVLLFLSFYINSGLFLNSILLDTLIEGLSIGGWVFLWEAIALVVFKNHDTRNRYRKYERLEQAAVDFIYL